MIVVSTLFSTINVVLIPVNVHVTFSAFDSHYGRLQKEYSQRGRLVKSYKTDNVSEDNKKYLPKIDLKYDYVRNKYNLTLFQHPKQNELTSTDVGDTKSQLPTSK